MHRVHSRGECIALPSPVLLLCCYALPSGNAYGRVYDTKIRANTHACDTTHTYASLSMYKQKHIHVLFVHTIECVYFIYVYMCTHKHTRTHTHPHTLHGMHAHTRKYTHACMHACQNRGYVSAFFMSIATLTARCYNCACC